MKWDGANRCWEAKWTNVKLGHEGAPAQFDELQLALYTPRGVYLYRHDLQLGVTSAGKRTGTAGYNIKLAGPRGEGEWALALDNAMLRKLDQHCERIAIVRWQVGPLGRETVLRR